MRVQSRSLGHTVVAAMVGVVVLVAAVLVFVADRTQKQLSEVMVAREVGAIAGTVEAIVTGEAEKAVALAASVVASPGVSEAFVAGDRARLLAVTGPIFDALRRGQVPVDQFQFHLPTATSFLRVHRPDQFGDDLSAFRATVVAANRERRVVAGLEAGVAGLGIRGVVPIGGPEAHRGTFEIGLSVGQAFVRTLGQRLGAEAALVARTRDGVVRLATTREGLGRLDPAAFESALALARPNGGLAFDGGQPLLVAEVPLKDFSGRAVAVLTVQRDASAVVAAKERAKAWQFGISVAFVVFALLLAALLARAMIRPLKRLTEETHAIASGDLVRNVCEKERGDEIGVLARAIDGFRKDVAEKRVQEARAAEERAGREKAQREMVLAMRTFGGTVRGVLTELGDASRGMLVVAERMHKIAAAVQASATGSRSEADNAATDLNSVAAATEELATSAREVR